MASGRWARGRCGALVLAIYLNVNCSQKLLPTIRIDNIDLRYLAVLVLNLISQVLVFTHSQACGAGGGPAANLVLGTLRATAAQHEAAALQHLPLEARRGANPLISPVLILCCDPEPNRNPDPPKPEAKM